jgi:hypothetical protein
MLHSSRRAPDLDRILEGKWTGELERDIRSLNRGRFTENRSKRISKEVYKIDLVGIQEVS